MLPAGSAGGFRVTKTGPYLLEEGYSKRFVLSMQRRANVGLDSDTIQPVERELRGRPRLLVHIGFVHALSFDRGKRQIIPARPRDRPFGIRSWLGGSRVSVIRQNGHLGGHETHVNVAVQRTTRIRFHVNRPSLFFFFNRSNSLARDLHPNDLLPR